MKTLTLISAAVVAATLLANTTAAYADEDARQPRSTLFTRMDKDGDGRLARSELPADARMQQRFEAMDTNKDGYVTEDEARAARQARMTEGKARIEQRLRQADINGDGQYSLDEVQANMPRLADRFNELDADKNGYLTREELRAARMHQHRQHSKERAAN
ncbi:MAG: hypothetical protein KDI32_00430 [Pseudomonadales bacterium]|nr:hypothetical protein [Pseudomonadales bacterium]